MNGLPKSKVTADLVPGEFTQRVRVRGPRGGQSRGRIPPERAEKGSAPRKRPSGRGGVYRGKIISVPIHHGELALIDAAAARLGMSRASFLRTAAHALIAVHSATGKAGP